MRELWIAIAVCLGLTGGAKAAEITTGAPLNNTYQSPYPWEFMDRLVPQAQEWSFEGYTHIRVEGDIIPGDAAKLTEVLNQIPPGSLAVVSFDSEGGDYREGLALADAISARNIATYVGSGDTCLSACALGFMGGRQEIIRRVFYAPNRFLHTEGTLGLHAPFNTSYPTIPTLNEQSMRLVADIFYAQAREAIRALQTRVTPLDIRPDFVFELLGKGPEEFLYVNRYREASQNQIRILTDQLYRPAQMNATSALLACAFVIEAAISPAQGFGDSIVPENWSDITHASVLGRGGGFPTAMQVEEFGNGSARFTLETILAGRGPFTCVVSNHPDGVWRANLDGDVPTVPMRLGADADLTRQVPYQVNLFSTLGPFVPWTWTKGDTLRLAGDGDIFAQVPEDLRRTSGPSFDCNGELDAAAQIICHFPVLAQADATMVAIYLKRRDDGVDGLRDKQRAWLQRRDSLCRPAWTDQANPTELTLTGYCLLAATVSQINALMWM